MKLPPIAWGAGAGLLVAAMLAPMTGAVLGELAKARGDRDRAAQALAAPEGKRGPLVVQGQALSDPAALVERIRARARDGGVLVEQVSVPAGRGALAIVRFRLSGPEKAVIALADALERDAPLVRLRNWQLVAIPGGVRLTAEAVAVKP